MSKLFIVQSNHTAVDQAGTPTTGATAPSGLAAPTVTPIDSGLQVAWAFPSEAGRSPLLKWTVAVSGGAGAATQDNIDPRLGFWEFDGLTNGTPYTVTLTASNQHGSISASASGTPAAPTLDPTTYNYATNTGPRVARTSTINTPNSPGRAYTASGTYNGVTFPAGSHASGATDMLYVIADGTCVFNDCEFFCPVRKSSAGATFNYCRINVEDIGEIAILGSSGAALDLNGTAYHCDIAGPGDGCWPGGQPGSRAVLDTCWIHPMVTRAYTWQTRLYGGAITDGSGNLVVTSTSAAVQPGTTGANGVYATVDQCMASVQFTTDGMTVDPTGVAGPMIVFSSAHGGAPIGYQVIGSVGGVKPVTLGPVTDAASWPTTSWDSLKAGNTFQPFVSGNAILIGLGSALHGDTMQWIGSGHTQIVNSKLDPYEDSTGLVQCVTVSKSTAFTCDFTQGSNVATNASDLSNCGVGRLLGTSVAVLPTVPGGAPARGSVIRSIDPVAKTLTLADAALLTQAGVSVTSTTQRPTQNIEWGNCEIGSAGATYWLGINGANIGYGLWDGATSSKNFGPYALWAAGTGPVPSNTSEYWDLNGLSCRGRQWGMYIHGCRFAKSLSNGKVIPTSMTQVTFSRGATIVKDIATWKQCLANELGLDVTADAAILQALWDDTYDWDQKPNVMGNLAANINQAVLNQRRAYGMMISSVSALTFIVCGTDNESYDPDTSATAALVSGQLGLRGNLLVPGTTNQYQTIDPKNFPQAWDPTTGHYIGA